jgi:Aspartyl protease/PDZ domain
LFDYEGLVVKARLVLFLIVTASSLLAGLWLRTRLQAAALADISMPRDGTEVPFEVYGGHLFIAGKLNGSAAGRFLLDNGAADVFISEAKARSLRLAAQSRVDIPGQERNIATIYVPNMTIQVGALTLKDHRSVVIPAAEIKGLSQYFGRTLDGIIGYEFFQQLVVEVDYAKRVLRLHRPKNYKYQGVGQRIPLQIENRRPYIEGTVQPYGYGAIAATLLVDLGSNGALSMTAGCGRDQALRAAVPKLLRRQATTIHGAQQIYLGRIRKLTLAQFRINTPLTIFETHSRNECDRIAGKIGTQILRQFRVIFDYPQQQLILEPQANLNRADAYEYDLSGLRLHAQGDKFKTYRVGAVFPETPAAKAGLQIGDILSQINQTSAEQMSLSQIRQQLSQPKTVSIQVKRGVQWVRFRLKLQPLL